MQPTQIRRGAPSDAAALADFAARTFADAFAADNRPEDMEAHLAKAYGVPQQTQELADPHVISLLAFQDGSLIAFYSKEGFTDVGSHEFYVGSDCQTDRVLVADVR